MKIHLQGNQKLYFSSDFHYAHQSLCRGVSKWNERSTRNFETLEQMNETIVSNINDKVKSHDILFFLGDFSFGGFDNIEILRKQINCQNLHLVLGNHDHHIEKNKNNCRSLFSSVNNYVHLKVTRPEGNVTNKYTFILFHYPISSWDGLKQGDIHLHGHCHLDADNRIGPGKIMDVGMDGNNLEPIELQEVLSIMKNQPIKSRILEDHHV